MKKNDYKVIDRHVKILEGVKCIDSHAFYYNNFKSVEIPNSVEIIDESAFFENNLTSLTIPNGVKTIGSYAFHENRLTDLIISNSVRYIGNSTFCANELVNVEIPNGVVNIGDRAFAANFLLNIKIPSSVKYIGSYAFAHNNLTNLIIENGLVNIDGGAFNNNNLTKVTIPKSVIFIGKNAFDNIDIIYDDVLIKKELIEKYGCENIIKLYNISKIIPLEKVCNNISKNILEVIPISADAIKGYIANKKVFYLFIDENLYGKEEIQDTFKLCFSLGLFSKFDKHTLKFIIKLINENNMDYIHQMWTSVKVDNFKPKFKDLFIKLYNEQKTEYNGQNFLGRLYSSFEKINAYTIKRHEEEISKKNTEIKRLKELGANTIHLEKELENLKKSKKDISYDDIVHYIKNNTFDVREGNEELKEIAPILSIHTDQTGFDKIQDIYELAKGVEKNIPLTTDKSDKDFNYHWSKSDNLINIILGYLVDCCAKLGGAGQDIMIQSMINPNIANLILYDENNNVIGKATAYYNRKKKYILFNNAETKEITTKGLKSEKQRKKECLEALIRGTLDAVKALREKGENVTEVRIGMLKNDLKEAIKEYGLEISHELLEAYNWKNYDGDASDKKEGQAILYKDDANGIKLGK